MTLLQRAQSELTKLTGTALDTSHPTATSEAALEKASKLAVIVTALRGSE